MTPDLQTMLSAQTGPHLKSLVHIGRSRLNVIARKKPPGWVDEVALIKRTINAIKDELESRGVWN